MKSRLLESKRSNGPSYLSLSRFKPLGFREKKLSFWFSPAIRWKLASSWIGVPLTRVRARKKESVQSCWRGREEESRRPRRVWHKVPLFHSLPRPLCPSIIYRLSAWQIATCRALEATGIVQDSSCKHYSRRLQVDMDAHCRCPPAATSLRVVLFPPEDTYLITVEILTFCCSYFSLIVFVILIQCSSLFLKSAWVKKFQKIRSPSYFYFFSFFFSRLLL